MGGEETGQGLRQEGRDGGGDGEQADMAAQAAGILPEFPAHLLELRQHRAGVMRHREPRRRRAHPTGAALQERDAAVELHAADALARGREGEAGALRAVGDALGLDHVEEQAEIGQVEAQRLWSSGGP